MEPSQRGTLTFHVSRYKLLTDFRPRVLVFAPAQREYVSAVWVDREGEEHPIGVRGIKPALQLSWPAISPDGSRVVYTKRTESDMTAWIYNFDTDREVQFLFGREGIDGDVPVWSPAGGELFYRDGQWVVAVGYQTDPVFTASSPEYLFEGPYRNEIYTWPTYDVDREGKKFFMFKRIGGSPFQTIQLVTNVLVHVGESS